MRFLIYSLSFLSAFFCERERTLNPPIVCGGFKLLIIPSSPNSAVISSSKRSSEIYFKEKLSEFFSKILIFPFISFVPIYIFTFSLEDLLELY